SSGGVQKPLRRRSRKIRSRKFCVFSGEQNAAIWDPDKFARTENDVVRMRREISIKHRLAGILYDPRPARPGFNSVRTPCIETEVLWPSRRYWIRKAPVQTFLQGWKHSMWILLQHPHSFGSLSRQISL